METLRISLQISSELSLFFSTNALFSILYFTINVLAPTVFFFVPKNQSCSWARRTKQRPRKDARTFLTGTALLGNTSCPHSLPANKRNGFLISSPRNPSRRRAPKHESSVLLQVFLGFFLMRGRSQTAGSSRGGDAAKQTAREREPGPLSSGQERPTAGSPRAGESKRRD